MTGFNSIQRPENVKLWASIYFYRPLSQFLSRYLAYLPFGPNFYTYLSGMFAIVFFIVIIKFPSHFYLGVIALFFYLLLDFIDGDIARIKKKTSIEGVYLDLMISFIANFAFFLGLGIVAFNMTNEIVYLYFSILNLFLYLVYKLLVGYHGRLLLENI